ncbi:hypothetical protein HDC92_005046 [Pedobacter sp. AK017]|uniref:hypothetical protein n=1 Tax=Pedobacter sp. AK017 TaxID=2723073 RepID=UPI00160B8729|nr:hypothetical protein [Pedobacter sp. AK017]MBB5441338.1 hypothetical protein [Pedobacter sp. AK017]
MINRAGMTGFTVLQAYISSFYMHILVDQHRPEYPGLSTIENLKFDCHEKSDLIFSDLHYCYRNISCGYHYEKSPASFYRRIRSLDVISLPARTKQKG